MFDEIEIEEEEFGFDYYDESDDETESSLVDYFEARAYNDIDEKHNSPFRKWHNEADAKEYTIRIAEC